jgi:hypothetical protein
MGLLHGLRDPDSGYSIARRLRSRRFAFFLERISDLPRPVSILDVGGTQDFWERMGFVDPGAARITILNLQAPDSRHPNVRTVAGDACRMDAFAEREFDVVFSNSVIEHVGDDSRQEAMANEVRRVGRRYFVQTPNLYFPIEPHFMFPFFQFLPIALRGWLLQNLRLSWGGRIREREAAREAARSVRLLDLSRLRSLFPEARIHRERVLGLTKSFIAFSGW